MQSQLPSGHLNPGARVELFSELSHPGTRELRYLSTNPQQSLVEGCSWEVDSLTSLVFHMSDEVGFGGHREMQQNAGAGPVCRDVVRVMGYGQDSDSMCYIALSPWLCS